MDRYVRRWMGKWRSSRQVQPWAAHSKKDIEGLKCVQRREQSWRKGLEHQEHLRELGEGLSLKKARLRGDLLTLYNSLIGWWSHLGVRLHSQGKRDRTRRSGLKLH